MTACPAASSTAKTTREILKKTHRIPKIGAQPNTQPEVVRAGTSTRECLKPVARVTKASTPIARGWQAERTTTSRFSLEPFRAT